MATFDRENVTRNEALGTRDRSNAPAWIAGIVIVAAIIIGAVVYESLGNHETTDRPRLTKRHSRSAQRRRRQRSLSPPSSQPRGQHHARLARNC